MNSIGNVTNVSVQYDKTSQTITCTSTGGPATDVTWSKDNVNIRLTMGGLYEHSQIIINISGYDLSCATSLLSDHGQMHEVRVPNICITTTRVQVSGLLPGTAYQCCVNAHIQTNTPLDLTSSNCVTASTSKSNKVSCCGDSFELIAGLGAGLCLLLVVVCMGSIYSS